MFERYVSALQLNTEIFVELTVGPVHVDVLPLHVQLFGGHVGVSGGQPEEVALLDRGDEAAVEQEPDLVPEGHGLAGVHAGLVQHVQGQAHLGPGGLDAGAPGQVHLGRICWVKVLVINHRQILRVQVPEGTVGSGRANRALGMPKHRTYVYSPFSVFSNSLKKS